MANAVATRYARALADAVLAPGSNLDAQAALEQLRSFEALIASSPELNNALLSPAVPVARKRAVAATLGRELGLPLLVQNYIFVLIDHHRTQILPDTIAAFEAQMNERLGLVSAQVTSAQDLSPERQQQIESELSRVTGKQVKAGFAVDPALLGGLVARIGSTIYDGSVRGQLDALRDRFRH